MDTYPKNARVKYNEFTSLYKKILQEKLSRKGNFTPYLISLVLSYKDPSLMTLLKPPANTSDEMVPTSTPSTMIAVCTASVHTTAFMPPWKANTNSYKMFIKKEYNLQYPKPGNHTSLENKYRITNPYENVH